MLAPGSAWKKITKKISFVLTSKMRNKENSTSDEEVSNQNLETEDFYDDDVFDVDEEIGSGSSPR